jgi:hypothetical protein
MTSRAPYAPCCDQLGSADERLEARVEVVARVSLVNNGKALLCVLAEPLGEDFWIVPEQTLTFITPDGEPMVSLHEDGASVWVNDGNPFDVVVTTESGEVVTCGFQRPPGAVQTPT